jgi:two-component system phosphate regulon response regulator PhoB
MPPEASGNDTCVGIRTDPGLAQTRVLMISARGTALERKRGTELGADGIISKPFASGDLREELRR